MKTHQISEYIDNLPLEKSFCKGYRPDEVYDVICTLSSMYNQVLSEAYEENEMLRQQISCQDSSEKNTQSSFLTDWMDEQTIEAERKVATVELQKEKQRDSMTDKELQRLKRGELLEILLEQSKENERLKLQLDKQNRVIEELNLKLEDRSITIREAGTIADASFKLNGVFDAAEKAAQQYLDNLKELYQKEQDSFTQKEKDTELKCTAMLQAMKERCYFMKEETTKKCNDMEMAVTEKCRNMEQEVRNRCQEIESETNRKSEELISLTEDKCRQREQEAEEKCIALDKKAKESVDKRWNELSVKLEEFYTAHQGIREILSMSKI